MGKSKNKKQQQQNPLQKQTNQLGAIFTQQILSKNNSGLGQIFVSPQTNLNQVGNQLARQALPNFALNQIGYQLAQQALQPQISILPIIDQPLATLLQNRGGNGASAFLVSMYAKLDSNTKIYSQQFWMFRSLNLQKCIFLINLIWNTDKKNNMISAIEQFSELYLEQQRLSEFALLRKQNIYHSILMKFQGFLPYISAYFYAKSDGKINQISEGIAIQMHILTKQIYFLASQLEDLLYSKFQKRKRGFHLCHAQVCFKIIPMALILRSFRKQFKKAFQQIQSTKIDQNLSLLLYYVLTVAFTCSADVTLNFNGLKTLMYEQEIVKLQEYNRIIHDIDKHDPAIKLQTCLFDYCHDISGWIENFKLKLSQNTTGVIQICKNLIASAHVETKTLRNFIKYAKKPESVYVSFQEQFLEKAKLHKNALKNMQSLQVISQFQNDTDKVLLYCDRRFNKIGQRTSSDTQMEILNRNLLKLLGEQNYLKYLSVSYQNIARLLFLEPNRLQIPLEKIYRAKTVGEWNMENLYKMNRLIREQTRYKIFIDDYEDEKKQMHQFTIQECLYWGFYLCCQAYDISWQKAAGLLYQERNIRYFYENNITSSYTEKIDQSKFKISFVFFIMFYTCLMEQTLSQEKYQQFLSQNLMNFKRFENILNDQLLFIIFRKAVRQYPFKKKYSLNTHIRGFSYYFRQSIDKSIFGQHFLFSFSKAKGEGHLIKDQRKKQRLLSELKGTQYTKEIIQKINQNTQLHEQYLKDEIAFRIEKNSVEDQQKKMTKLYQNYENELKNYRQQLRDDYLKVDQRRIKINNKKLETPEYLIEKQLFKNRVLFSKQNKKEENNFTQFPINTQALVFNLGNVNILESQQFQQSLTKNIENFQEKVNEANEEKGLNGQKLYFQLVKQLATQKKQIDHEQFIEQINIQNILVFASKKKFRQMQNWSKQEKIYAAAFRYKQEKLKGEFNPFDYENEKIKQQSRQQTLKTKSEIREFQKILIEKKQDIIQKSEKLRSGKRRLDSLIDQQIKQLEKGIISMQKLAKQHEEKYQIWVNQQRIETDATNIMLAKQFQQDALEDLQEVKQKIKILEEKINLLKIEKEENKKIIEEEEKKQEQQISEINEALELFRQLSKAGKQFSFQKILVEVSSRSLNFILKRIFKIEDNIIKTNTEYINLLKSIKDKLSTYSLAKLKKLWAQIGDSKKMFNAFLKGHDWNDERTWIGMGAEIKRKYESIKKIFSWGKNEEKKEDDKKEKEQQQQNK